MIGRFHKLLPLHEAEGGICGGLYGSQIRHRAGWGPGAIARVSAGYNARAAKAKWVGSLR